MEFVRWYNKDHKHSGLNFLTPNQRHNGLSNEVFEKRKEVYEMAKKSNPIRWTRQTRDWSLNETVWLNPERVIQKIEEEKILS